MNKINSIKQIYYLLMNKSTQKLNTLMLEMMAVAQRERKQEVTEKMGKGIDVRSSNANNAQWTTVPVNQVDREVMLQITQMMVIQTTSGMMGILATIPVSQDMASVTTSTSNICTYNLTKSVGVLHYLPLPENAI